jgi:ArsR family transcriptional regulator, arsenate/arsenite/antimonite-responsive transcriptional repressor
MVELLAPPPAQRRGNRMDASSPLAKEATEPRVPPLADDVAEDLLKLFKLLGDETRLRILHALMCVEEMNVRTLCQHLGQSQPAVSHHLALLRTEGLIEPRRDGKHNFYRILPERFQELLDRISMATPNAWRRLRPQEFEFNFTHISRE